MSVFERYGENEAAKNLSPSYKRVKRHSCTAPARLGSPIVEY